jgi:hypothetical protein
MTGRGSLAVCTLGFFLWLAPAAAASVAAAHPSDGYEPGTPWPEYGMKNLGLPAEASLGQLTFTQPYGQPAELTGKEKYYLFGTTSSSTGYPLGAYYMDVMEVVYRLYNINGYLPSKLSEKEVADSLGLAVSEVDQLYMDTLRSPITGDFPSLDCASFAPGQFFVQVLNESEIKHFSQYLSILKGLYYNGEWWDDRNSQWQPGKLLGSVMYVRVYGERGVIYEQIYFASR